MDDEIYGTEDYDGSEAWDKSGYYEWDPSPSHHDEAEYYEDPEAFDSSAAYYQYDDETAAEQSIPGMTWNYMTRHMQHTWMPERGSMI